jgi:hypothetical protein
VSFTLTEASWLVTPHSTIPFQFLLVEFGLRDSARSSCHANRKDGFPRSLTGRKEKISIQFITAMIVEGCMQAPACERSGHES